MIENNKYNAPLYAKYQPQMADGHPIVKYSREEAIEKMKLMVTIERKYEGGMLSFFFNDYFYLSDTEYGHVKKYVEIEIYMQEGEFEWWSDTPPFHLGYSIFRWVRIQALIDTFHKVINMGVEFSEYNWDILYNEKYYRNNFLLKMKDGSEFTLSGNLAKNPNVYRGNVQVGYFNEDDITSVRLSDIESISMI
jgi:hypothetical protein